MTQLPNCHDCGRFMTVTPGAAWQMLYSGHPPTPDREIFKCKSCVERNGPFLPQSGIRPECSCGLVARPSKEEAGR